MVSLTQAMNTRKKLFRIYTKLYDEFGPRNWWPGDTPFEVIIGAILTQNTAWLNVEKAIKNLKKAGLLKPKKLFAIKTKRLASLIRPAGYYNIKASRLKNFLNFLFDKHGGSVDRLLKVRMPILREQLLQVNGIGPETADSIILYAAKKPVFVVDAYTRRMFSRHKLINDTATYQEIQDFFMKHLPKKQQLFNEYHALIVELGKNICKTKPNCSICPLESAPAKKR